MAPRLPGSQVSLLSLLALCYYCSPVLACLYNGRTAGSAHASGSLVGSSPRLSDSQMAAELRSAGGRGRPARADTGADTGSVRGGAAPGSWSWPPEAGPGSTGPGSTVLAGTGPAGPAGRGGRSYRLDMTGQGPDRQIV